MNLELKQESKQELLKVFFVVGGNHKSNESKTVKDRLNDYIETYGDDIQINDLLRLSKTEELERRYGNFEKGCEILTPTLKRLANTADLDKWDVRILAASIGHVENFEDIQLQFEKNFQRDWKNTTQINQSTILLKRLLALTSRADY